MLAHQDKRVGEDIESDSETAAGNTHHELVFFEFFATLFVYAHTGILTVRRFESCYTSFVIADDAENLVQLAVH